MEDFLFTAFGAGLHDGLNPCAFMTCAVFITHGLWLKGRPFPITASRIVFALAYACCILIFNFGIGQVLILNQYFVLAARFLYLVWGIGAFILGILFFKDWVLLRRGVILPQAGPGKGLSAQACAAVWVATLVMAALLSAMATLWPMDKYILLFGNVAMIRGRWETAFPLLGSYAIISMWPLWLAWVFFSIKNLQPSFFKIFCAAIFFTASSCIIFMFR